MDKPDRLAREGGVAILSVHKSAANKTGILLRITDQASAGEYEPATPLVYLATALGTSKTTRGIAVVLSNWPSDVNESMASIRRGPGRRPRKRGPGRGNLEAGR